MYIKNGKDVEVIIELAENVKVLSRLKKECEVVLTETRADGQDDKQMQKWLEATTEMLEMYEDLLLE